MQSKNVDELLKRWTRAQSHLNAMRQEINSAECELANAKNALGKFLCPENSGNGETFSIWVNAGTAEQTKDKLLNVTRNSLTDFTVDWYKP